MKVSVIISTYNSPDWLEKVLWGYTCQDYTDFEIIIADDGSGRIRRISLSSFRRTPHLKFIMFGMKTKAIAARRS